MITNLLITSSYTVLGFFLKIFPHVYDMPSWYDGFELYVIPTLSGLFTFPIVGTMFIVVFLGFSIKVSYELFQWSTWLYNKIRGSG